MTKRERQQYATARAIPSNILALAAIDQAKNCMLSEAQASEVAGAFNEAAWYARKRREKAMRSYNPSKVGTTTTSFTEVAS